MLESGAVEGDMDGHTESVVPVWLWKAFKLDQNLWSML